MIDSKPDFPESLSKILGQSLFVFDKEYAHRAI